MCTPIAPKIEAGSVFAFTFDDLIAGIIVLEIRDRHLFIETVAVPPRLQGNGVGTKLMRFAESYAREQYLGEIRLHANATIVENVARYERLGYARTHEAIEDGFRRIFMRLVLVYDRPIV